MTAGVLIGVVANDRGVRETAVHPLVDPRDSRGDLVDDAMEVIDACLERDGEVDQIVLALPEDDALCPPEATQLDVEGSSQHHCDPSRDGRAQGDPAGRRLKRPFHPGFLA